MSQSNQSHTGGGEGGWRGVAPGEQDLRPAIKGYCKRQETFRRGNAEGHLMVRCRGSDRATVPRSPLSLASAQTVVYKISTDFVLTLQTIVCNNNQWLRLASAGFALTVNIS